MPQYPYSLDDLYGVAKEHEIIVVGGAEPSVGLGGYLTGGPEGATVQFLQSSGLP
jgi:hypothetical protein